MDMHHIDQPHLFIKGTAELVKRQAAEGCEHLAQLKWTPRHKNKDKTSLQV